MGKAGFLARMFGRLIGRKGKQSKAKAKGYFETQKHRLRALVLVLVVAASVGSVVGHRYEFSVGERSGRLIKFSREGVFFKTWEGQLRLSESAAQNWSFTVPNESIALELQQRMGEDLTLHYSKRLVGLWWVGETSYLIDGVR